VIASISLSNVRTDVKSHASLICSESCVAPGTIVDLAIRLNPAPGWHTYWRNPGDSGGPTTFALKLPVGWTQLAPTWPLPNRLDLSGVVSYGYKSTVLLVIPVQIPKNFSATSVSIAGRVKWLTCTDEVCKPADQNVSLRLEVGPAHSSPQRTLIENALNLAAKTDSNAQSTAFLGKQGIELRVKNWRPSSNPTDYYFFPESTGVLDHSGPERFSLDGSTLVAQLPKSPYSSAPPKKVVGILTSRNGKTREAIVIDVSVQRKQ
jgi:DsbC/DsbD-like thiol-disulfide interchange protein